MEFKKLIYLALFSSVTLLNGQNQPIIFSNSASSATSLITHFPELRKLALQDQDQRFICLAQFTNEFALQSFKNEHSDWIASSYGNQLAQLRCLFETARWVFTLIKTLRAYRKCGDKVL